MRRVYDKCEKIFGLDKCIMRQEDLFSENSLLETLQGKRVIFSSLLDFKNILTDRVRYKKSCGFHLAETSISKVPVFMLFNKMFDKRFKKKIDSK